MIRITSGLAKNKKLNAPELEKFRAVQEKAKLAIFSILDTKVENAVCLDLFAGSGNLGIEALSRGASWCDFVDTDPGSIENINTNIFTTGFSDKAEVFRRDAVKYVVHTDKKYDIIFADPFYDNTAVIHLFNNLGNIMQDDGNLIFLHGNQLNIEHATKDAKLKITTTRKFGKGFFSVLEKDL